MITLGHIIFYVQDVEKTMAFYETAFGIEAAFIDPTGHYGQMETGGTALAFASYELARQNLPKDFRAISPKELPGCEISFSTSDVQKSLTHAVNSGAELVAPPQEKPWGQIVAYVRDFNGILIEISSLMAHSHDDCGHCSCH